MTEPAKLIPNTNDEGTPYAMPCLFCSTVTRFSVRVINSTSAVPICIRCGCSLGADAEDLKAGPLPTGSATEDAS